MDVLLHKLALNRRSDGIKKANRLFCVGIAHPWIADRDGLSMTHEMYAASCEKSYQPVRVNAAVACLIGPALFPAFPVPWFPEA